MGMRQQLWRSGLLVGLLAALAGCACPTGASSRASGLTKSADGRVWTFHATTVDDLALPAQQAWSEALSSAEAHEFRLTLAPGRYEGFALTLEDTALERELTLVVEGVDGVATLSGGAMKLGSAKVELRGVVLTQVRSEGPALQIQVSKGFVAERVALVDNTRTSKDADAPLVALRARGKGAVATATWRDSWFVGNISEGGDPLIATPLLGQAKLASLTFERVVFAGNKVNVLVEPWFTARVELRRALVAEEHLNEAVFGLQSPLVKVDLHDSTLSGHALVGLRTSIDVARGDFQKVGLHGSEAQTSERTSDDAVVADEASKLGTRPRTLDLEAAREAALGGEAPDIGALGGKAP